MADSQGGGAGPDSGPSLFGSLRSFWSVLLATFYTRLDTAFFFAMLWILAAFWDTPYRLWVIGGIFGIYAISGAVFIFAAYNIVTNWPGFLGQTIKELRKDVEGLQVLVAKDKEVTK
jgi:hypothetical protein